jgi:hypothetical protein
MMLRAFARSFVLVTVLCPGTIAIASEWPQSDIEAIASKCHQRPRADVPAQYQTAYCECQTNGIAAAIPWKEFENADKESQTKDVTNISREAEGTMIAAAMVVAWCVEHVVPHLSASADR